MNQGPGKCSRCLLRCWCVHSMPFLQVTELLIDLGQATNMNWYRRNHVGWHAVTTCNMVLWSLSWHHAHIVIQSYINHTHTVIQVQAYTYNHAMMSHTGTWATSLHGCMCILVSVWLYVYDWCMIVWQCAHDGMMTIIRPYTVSNSVSSNMIASVSIHVGWDTWWGSGRFRCRYLVRSRRFPLQIPVAIPEGSGADTWSASGGFLCRYLLRFRALVLLPLCSTIACLYVYDCICMIVCVWLYDNVRMMSSWRSHDY